MLLSYFVTEVELLFKFQDTESPQYEKNKKNKIMCI
jgi:hypothetical protein